MKRYRISYCSGFAAVLVICLLCVTANCVAGQPKSEKNKADSQVTKDKSGQQAERPQSAKDIKEINWKKSTLKAYDKVLNGEYSEEYSIGIMNGGNFESGHTKMIREANVDIDKYWELTTISIFIENSSDKYMLHGINSKMEEGEEPVPDKGIPLDADPQAIIIFPPGNEGEPEIVRQYPLVIRC